MTTYTVLVTVALIISLIYLYYANRHNKRLRGRNRALRGEVRSEKRRGDHWQQEAERKDRLMDEYIMAASVMEVANTHLELRNLWLEHRRHVILLRWWQRREYRTLSGWKVRYP